MFDKKFKIVLVLGIVIILLLLFGKNIINAVGSTDKISTFTESNLVTYYKKACAYEDSSVCNELGDMYHYGHKTASIDYEEAIEYYKKACELEDGKGCNNLAYMLNQGKGITKNNWTAIRLYKKACKYNEMEACYNVGSMYYEGEGTKKNYYNAAHYFRMSCDENNKVRIGAACSNLGYMYEHGKYFKKDISKALQYYMTACTSLKEDSACNNLAYFYERRGNRATAKQYYEKGCALNNTYSCNKVEDVLRKEINVIKDEDALEKAKNACAQSTQGGTMCYRVGLYYENQKETKNARQFFEKACERRHSKSCKHLGDLYL